MTLPQTAATPAAEQALQALADASYSSPEVLRHLEEQVREALRDVAAEAATDEDEAEVLYRRLIRETGLTPV